VKQLDPVRRACIYTDSQPRFVLIKSQQQASGAGMTSVGFNGGVHGNQAAAAASNAKLCS